jgi:multiple sugar transport system permease protein
MTTESTTRNSAGSSLAPRRRGVAKARKWPYVLPAFVLLALLSIYPLIQLVRMSLSSVSLQTLNQSWPFVALQNFIDGFQSGVLWQGLGYTVIFVIVVTILGLVVGVGAAIALRGKSWFGAFVLALMVFVWALPPVVNGSVWKFLLADDGLFNTVLHGIGLPSAPFLYDQHWALLSVAFVNSWAVIPFNTLVFRAGILNIPDELFEAAQLDGASAWQQVRNVILPTLRPTTIVLAVLTIVYAFRSFDFIYVMTQGGPGTATETLPFLSYQQAFVQYNFGQGSATAILAVVLVLVLAVIYARSVLKEESS